MSLFFHNFIVSVYCNCHIWPQWEAKMTIPQWRRSGTQRHRHSSRRTAVFTLSTFKGEAVVTEAVSMPGIMGLFLLFPHRSLSVPPSLSIYLVKENCYWRQWRGPVEDDLGGFSLWLIERAMGKGHWDNICKFHGRPFQCLLLRPNWYKG